MKAAPISPEDEKVFPEAEKFFKQGQQVARRSRRRSAVRLKIYGLREWLGSKILPFDPYDHF